MGTKKNCSLTFHATRKPTPIGKNNQGQLLPAEVLDGLRSLVGRVREPNLASLANQLCFRVNVGGVSGKLNFYCPGLDCNHPDRNAAQPAPASDDSVGPAAHDLIPGSVVQETVFPNFFVGCTSEIKIKS